MKARTLLASIALLAVALQPALAVVVDANNPNGWAYYSTDSSGVLNTGAATIAYVNGPATPPAGTGSLNFKTAAGQGDGSAQARLLGWEGTKLADLTTLKYSTYATSWNGAQLPFFNIYLNLAGDVNGGRTDRLWFEPAYSNGLYGNNDPNPQADVALNTWQTWDILNGMVYNDNGPSGPGADAVPFSFYLAANPNAVIVASAPGIGGIRIASGFASPGDDYDTNIDLVEIGTAALGTTSYNFEVAAVPEASAVLFAGLACGVSGGIALVRGRRARRA